MKKIQLLGVCFLVSVFMMKPVLLISQNAQKVEKQVKVLIHTEYGDMKAVLYNETPKHRDNFVKLIKEDWYKGSPFHRIIKDFMIQGGGNVDGRDDPGYTVDAEFNKAFIHKKGALAAARTSDQVNPKKASSGSQFYIVQGKKYQDEQLNMMEQRIGFKYTPEQREAYKTVGGTPFLDGSYTVFGQVYEGLDVIDKIAAVKTIPGDQPEKPVQMTITLIK